MSEPKLVQILKGLARVTVTLGLTAATMFAAFVNQDAVEILLGPTGLVVGWWFRSRDAERNGSR